MRFVSGAVAGNIGAAVKAAVCPFVCAEGCGLDCPFNGFDGEACWAKTGVVRWLDARQQSRVKQQNDARVKLCVMVFIVESSGGNLETGNSKGEAFFDGPGFDKRLAELRFD